MSLVVTQLRATHAWLLLDDPPLVVRRERRPGRARALGSRCRSSPGRTVRRAPTSGLSPLRSTAPTSTRTRSSRRRFPGVSGSPVARARCPACPGTRYRSRSRPAWVSERAAARGPPSSRRHQDFLRVRRLGVPLVAAFDELHDRGPLEDQWRPMSLGLKVVDAAYEHALLDHRSIALRLQGVTAASCSAFRYSRVTRSRLEKHRPRPRRGRRRPGSVRDGVQSAQFRGLDVQHEARPGAELGRSPHATSTCHAHTVQFRVSRFKPVGPAPAWRASAR